MDARTGGLLGRSRRSRKRIDRHRWQRLLIRDVKVSVAKAPVEPTVEQAAPGRRKMGRFANCVACYPASRRVGPT